LNFLQLDILLAFLLTIYDLCTPGLVNKFRTLSLLPAPQVIAEVSDEKKECLG